MTTRGEALNTMKKVYQLVVRGGTPEESHAAQVRLEALMVKYDISMNDLLATDPVETVWFGYKGDYEKSLLAQIVAKVRNSHDIKCYDGYKVANGRRTKKRNTIGFDLTEAEAIEVRRLFEVYRNDLKATMDTAFQAFWIKNNIFAADCTREAGTLTAAEREAWLKSLAMAEGISASTVYRPLMSHDEKLTAISQDRR